jgi:hypothetical protein
MGREGPGGSSPGRDGKGKNAGGGWEVAAVAGMHCGMLAVSRGGELWDEEGAMAFFCMLCLSCQSHHFAGWLVAWCVLAAVAAGVW